MFDRVFSRYGLLRRTRSTVVLATHSGKHWPSLFRSRELSNPEQPVQWLPEADKILVLGQNGEIVEQGSFDRLHTSGGYTQSLDIMKRASDVLEDSSCKEEVKVQIERQVSQPAEELPNRKDQTIADLAVWKYYAKALGWLQILGLGIFLSMNAGFGAVRCESLFFGGLPKPRLTCTDLWLTWWAERGAGGSLGYWLGIYTALGVLETAGLALSCL